MKQKLKIKLFFIQLVSILPFLVFIFYLFDLWYDTKRSQIIENHLQKAKLIALCLHQSFQQGIKISESLAHDPLFLQSLSTDKKQAEFILKTLVNNFGELHAINVRDKKGRILTTTLNLTPEQKEISALDREHLQKVLTTKKSVLSNPFIGRYTGKNIIALSAPIIQDNEVEHIVSTAMEVDTLKEKIERNLTLAGNGINGKKLLVVLDKNKEIVFIAGQPFPSEEEKLLLKDFPLLKEMENKKIAVLENQKLPLSEETLIGGMVSVENFQWIVLSAESVNNAFAPLFEVQKTVWLILFFALLFSVGVITYFLRKLRLVY